MRVFALGEMGLLPNEFYEMDIEDFSLKAEGFLDSRIWFERSLRRLGQVLQAPHVDKSAPSMLAQWPISKDDEMGELRKENVERNSVKTLAQFIKNAQGEKNEN